jgi:hypothetical protein
MTGIAHFCQKIKPEDVLTLRVAVTPFQLECFEPNFLLPSNLVAV